MFEVGVEELIAEAATPTMHLDAVETGLAGQTHGAAELTGLWGGLFGTPAVLRMGRLGRAQGPIWASRNFLFLDFEGNAISPFLYICISKMYICNAICKRTLKKHTFCATFSVFRVKKRDKLGACRFSVRLNAFFFEENQTLAARKKFSSKGNMNIYG